VIIDGGKIGMKTWCHVKCGASSDMVACTVAERRERLEEGTIILRSDKRDDSSLRTPDGCRMRRRGRMGDDNGDGSGCDNGDDNGDDNGWASCTTPGTVTRWLQLHRLARMVL
jgi:hypothetical protein